LNILTNLCLAAAVFLGVLAGWEPLRRWVLKQEQIYGHILRTGLLLDIRPRSATFFGAGCVVVAAVAGYGVVHDPLALIAGAVLGAAVPMLMLRFLRRRRLAKLEDQLVDAVQALSSGVRAGLNLVQALELVAQNLPAPVSQEFAHLLREYEYGVPIESAMANAASRVDLGNYRLLFSALQTHRQRGGDLGATLDRIAESIREIQRLEKRVETLTAQGRAAARWMACITPIILAILYFIDPVGVTMLFTDDIGRLLLAAIVVMNVAGFAWIKRIVAIDI
jgi:tight adherence protein B